MDYSAAPENAIKSIFLHYGYLSIANYKHPFTIAFSGVAYILSLNTRSNKGIESLSLFGLTQEPSVVIENI